MGIFDKPSMKYLTYSVIFTLAIMIATIVDINLIHVNVCSLLVKIVAIYLMIVYIRKHELHIIRSSEPKYYAFIILPAILTLILEFKGFGSYPGFGVVVIGFLSMIATILSEELLYRVLSTHLLCQEKLTVKQIAFIISVTLLPCIVTFIFNGFGNFVLQILTVATFGVFVLGLYVRTDNAIVPILAHFATACMSWLCNSFGTKYSTGMWKGMYIFIYTIMMVLYTVFGVILLKKEYAQEIDN